MRAYILLGRRYPTNATGSVNEVLATRSRKGQGARSTSCAFRAKRQPLRRHAQLELRAPNCAFVDYKARH